MHIKKIGNLYKITTDVIRCLECDNENYFMLSLIKIKENDILLYLGQKKLKQCLTSSTKDVVMYDSEDNKICDMHQFLHRKNKICYPVKINFDNMFKEIEYEQTTSRKIIQRLP